MKQYIKVLFAVNVNWNSDYRKWNVNDWHLDENGNWNAGNQVFRNSLLFFSLLPRPRVGGVMFFYLPEPSTKHFPYFIERNGK